MPCAPLGATRLHHLPPASPGRPIPQVQHLVPTGRGKGARHLKIGIKPRPPPHVLPAVILTAFRSVIRVFIGWKGTPRQEQAHDRGQSNSHESPLDTVDGQAKARCFVSVSE